jgi:hypothetical protein
MQALIWLSSVLLGLSCSFFWSIGVFVLALPAALKSPLVVNIMPLSLCVSFAALVGWVAGLMAMWKIMIWFTERLVEWISPADSEKKKKRPPLEL